MAIPCEVILALAQDTEEIAITKADNTIITELYNMLTALVAWTVQMRDANETRYGGYQTTRAYAIQVDHAPPHTPLEQPPPDALTGPPDYRPGPNYP